MHFHHLPININYPFRCPEKNPLKPFTICIPQLTYILLSLYLTDIQFLRKIYNTTPTKLEHLRGEWKAVNNSEAANKNSRKKRKEGKKNHTKEENVLWQCARRMFLESAKKVFRIQFTRNREREQQWPALTAKPSTSPMSVCN